MSRFLRENAKVEIRGITFEQFYRNACDRFEYYVSGDPEAAAQNFCCEIEKMMGIFPNTSPSEPKDAGSGEGQAWQAKWDEHVAKLSNEEQADALSGAHAEGGAFTLDLLNALHAAGYRITRTAPSGAKP